MTYINPVLLFGGILSLLVSLGAFQMAYDLRSCNSPFWGRIYAAAVVFIGLAVWMFWGCI